MRKYIDSEKLIAEINNRLMSVNLEELGNFGCHRVWAYNDVKDLIASLQQEQPKKLLIQVKCLYPYDVSWQKNKVYTCEVWHHGDLNRDFWDVYYDYGKDPKYVQFPTIELLNEEFVIIQEESHAKQERPEVDFETEYAKFSNDPDALDYAFPIDLADYKDFARHFYELGLNARKEE